jgi:uncharacterized protein YbaR (Trm112 family)
MIHAELLAILRCPENHSPLREVDAAFVAKLNAAAASKQIRNRGGELVTQILDGGLIRSDDAWVYPIVDGIPIMLVDEAIATAQLTPVGSV